MAEGFITVKGARQHNLKNIDVKIPRDKFVVITGVSGSGKSSLAFDTIYVGEEAGYAGGIMSAAIDGANSAKALLELGTGA